MKRSFAAVVALWCALVAAGLMLTPANAVAASAKCAAFCDNWCAKNFAIKNSTACSERCQIKHCK